MLDVNFALSEIDNMIDALDERDVNGIMELFRFKELIIKLNNKQEDGCTTDKK